MKVDETLWSFKGEKIILMIESTVNNKAIIFKIYLWKLAITLPWSSGPTVVINAVKHFPIHWWTSIWVGAICSSNFKTMDKVGST